MATRPLSIVTFNVLNDLLYWEDRLPLILEGLRRLAPDVIALQEVTLPRNTAAEIAAALGDYAVHLTPKGGRQAGHEALALLSRVPIAAGDGLAFPGRQGRIAQRIGIRHGGVDWTIANAHLHWSPFDDRTRVRQVRQLVSWLPPAGPVVVCGDFNAEPHYLAMALMRRRFASAYAAVHGAEPEFTFPTRLRRGPHPRHAARNATLGVLGPMLKGHKGSWRGTLDYIFVDPAVRVQRCELALDQPAAGDPRLFPSDHRAMAAELTWSGTADPARPPQPVS